MGALERYMQLTGQGVNAQPHTEEQSVSKSLPKVDSSNAIGSLAALLGPTRAELEAQERHRQESKAKMSAWTGFFDGIRQLSNLYYTTRGATPQKYTDNPYQQVEQMVQADRQRADELANYERSYRQLLYNLQRQSNEERRKDILSEAQAKYYGTRDEVARQKAELDKLKAVKVIKQTDGSLIKYDPITGETSKLSEADPLYVEYQRSRINKNNQQGAAATTRANRAGVAKNNDSVQETVEWIDEKGQKHKKVTKTNGSRQASPSKKRSSSSVRTPRNGATNNSGFFNK